MRLSKNSKRKCKRKRLVNIALGKEAGLDYIEHNHLRKSQNTLLIEGPTRFPWWERWIGEKQPSIYQEI